jgi:hypothetical protein
MKNPLGNFTLAAVERPRVASADPVMIRRNAMVKRLEDQRQLFLDPSYAKVARHKAKDGTVTEKAHRVAPAWTTSEDGKAHFYLRMGYTDVCLAPGKNAIVAKSVKEVPALIDALISETKAGNLDEALAKASVEISSKLKGKGIAKKAR